jgi:TPP-dependent 2-oxoacid decarboxylase
LNSSNRTALIADDIEVALARLKRAKEAIQEIRPILLSCIQKEQPRYTETGRIYMNYMNDLVGREARAEVPERSAEADRQHIFQEAMSLLGEISSLIQANKAKIILASGTEEHTKTRAVESGRAGELSTKDDMSPEQSFYFSLANSDLGALRRSTSPVAER